MAKTFIEITDLPTDKFNTMHKLRPELVQVFNKARGTEYKMKLLKETLKFMYTQCTAYEKVAIEELEQAARNAILKEAKTLGIDLDERLSTEKLEAELSAAIVANDS
jgi:hypothetical protein